MRHVRRADAVQVEGSPARPSYDPSVFPGVWINVNPRTTGIARLDITSAGQGLRIAIHAVGPQGMISWGTVERVTLFASGPAMTSVVGFTAMVDLGFVEVRLQANLNKGLMVLASYTRFKDGSGRVDSFTREYFSSVPSDRYPPGTVGPQEV